ncbi:hypothetical protein V7174_13585 [Bacillus subtilis]|uniref:hypothetical protein n=1 Tax=Bacillus subtilis TaxID=1423 RepID=UPI002DBBD5F3|nr:hypothetical protein [Bacillus subtilis]MEC2197828.1 hypothetical protein [Bacillus subtilis]
MADFEIVSEVTTEPTGLDGVRHSAYSNWDSISAPDGHVIDDRSLTYEWLSAAGSENNYEKVLEDFVPILENAPDLKYPQTLKIRTFAKGPKGHSSGRGWSKLKVTGKYIKYK